MVPAVAALQHIGGENLCVHHASLSGFGKPLKCNLVVLRNACAIVITDAGLFFGLRMIGQSGTIKPLTGSSAIFLHPETLGVGYAHAKHAFGAATLGRLVEEAQGLRLVFVHATSRRVEPSQVRHALS